jgi:hypothetical protein
MYCLDTIVAISGYVFTAYNGLHLSYGIYGKLWHLSAIQICVRTFSCGAGGRQEALLLHQREEPAPFPSCTLASPTFACVCWRSLHCLEFRNGVQSLRRWGTGRLASLRTQEEGGGVSPRQSVVRNRFSPAVLAYLKPCRGLYGI